MLQLSKDFKDILEKIDLSSQGLDFLTWYWKNGAKSLLCTYKHPSGVSVYSKFMSLYF